MTRKFFTNFIPGEPVDEGDISSHRIGSDGGSRLIRTFDIDPSLKF